MDESPGNPSRHTSLEWAAQYHNDAVESFNHYLSVVSPKSLSQFDAYSRPRLDVGLADYIQETDLRSSLELLTKIEAAFQLDYQFRCRKRLKDDLSWAFRALYKRDQRYVSLEKDILDAWSCHASEAHQIIGELRSAFKFRHWLAHGRYWTPKLGRKYDFQLLYILALTVFENLPLRGTDED
ncbi:MAG: hypothetical protein ABSD44_14745 [Terracidiphilus sp.]